MEYQPAEYQRLQVAQFPPKALRETAEGRYWREFKPSFSPKQVGPVSHIDFCAIYPYHIAATSSTRVLAYNPQHNSLHRQFTRFKDTAYSGVYRSDGRLITAGCQDGIVRVFDAASRGVLRLFKGHARPAHVARWAPDRLHVLSGADDVTVRWWDVANGAQVLRLDGHTDYVRAAAVNPQSPDNWATGAYDHMFKLWDVRAGGAACIMTLDHGAPIEDIAWFPSGSLAVTAGGNWLCVWDLVAGGRQLARLSNFQKTVTCVRLSPTTGRAGSQAVPRMMAGSLDGHVKVFELETFKMTHASQYKAPVLSLGVSPDCGLLAVGLADGTLSIRKHVRPRVLTSGPSAKPVKRVHYQRRLTASNYRYFIRGTTARAAQGDHRVQRKRRVHLALYDKMLQKFRFRDSLDAALRTRQAEVVVSLLQELATRGALDAALAGRTADSVMPLMIFLTRNLVKPRYTKFLSGVLLRVLDTYAVVASKAPLMVKHFSLIQHSLREEAVVCSQLLTMLGLLEPLLSASFLSQTVVPAAVELGSA